MKQVLITIIIAGLSLISCEGIKAQRHRDCGTELKGSEKETYSRVATASRNPLQQQKLQASFYYVRLFIHNFISDDASDSAWSYKEVIDEFNEASGYFNQYGMCLVLAGLDFPRNTTFKDSFHTSNFNSLSSLHHGYAIDVTLHKKLSDEDGGLNGVAYTLPGKWISLSRGAIGQRSFAHEVGHCLGLLHTFEPAYCLECPDGSNSADCGDKILDTRATPDTDSIITANTNASCIYIGNQTIFCNNSTQNYNPEIINMMCYGRRTCRSIFSQGQVAVMKFVLDNFSVMQSTWFGPPGFTQISSPFGPITINWDDYYSGSSILIGNYSSTINVTMGGNTSQQKMVSSFIRISPGVRLRQPSGDRGRIRIRAFGYCQE